VAKLNNLIDNLNNKNKKGRDYLMCYQEGSYVFKILPAIEGEEEAPFESFVLHGGFIHPMYQKSSNFRCLKTKDCPMCLEAKKIKESGDPESWRYEAKEFYLYNVIDRKDGRLKLLKLNWNAHQQVLAKMIEAARLEINLMSINYGRDLELNVRSVNSKLTYKAFILSEKESKPVADKILEEVQIIKPLHETYKFYSKEELKDIVNGKMPKTGVGKKKVLSKSKLIESLTANLDESMKKEITKDNEDLFEEDT